MALTSTDRALLRRVPLFAALADDDLDWIARACQTVDLDPGDALAAEGDEGEALFVITDGELEVVKRSRSADVPLARLGPGEIVGEMAVLEGSPRNATIRAVATSRVIAIGREVVLELVRTRPSAAMSIIRTVTGRLRSTEALLREREKLAALGTLSAGLAHELNNPAAAVQRSSGLLRETLDRWANATHALGGVVSDAQRAAVVGDLGTAIPRLAASGASSRQVTGPTTWSGIWPGVASPTPPGSPRLSPQGAGPGSACSRRARRFPARLSARWSSGSRPGARSMPSSTRSASAPAGSPRSSRRSRTTRTWTRRPSSRWT
jgi:CRP-like cAMP-binding protein